MLPNYRLGQVHHAEALRVARERRTVPRRDSCRRRVFRLPIGPACQPAPAC